MNMGNINFPRPKQEYKVLVRCFTFNQSKYIEDALNGFAMQQTNFPFACLIMDDASTDGEQDVIKAWMERECDMSRAESIDISTSVVIIVPHRTNLSCTFAFYMLKQNLYRTGGKEFYVNPWREKCEYEAICEGDDYWVDSNKLTKQVTILENNKDYGLCYTNGYVFTDNYLSKSLIKDHYCDNIAKKLILNDNFILTNSVLIRMNILQQSLSNIKEYNQNWLMGDYPLWIEVSLLSKIYFISDYTCVYRILQESASHSVDIERIERFYQSSKDIQLFYAKKVGLNDLDNYFLINYYAKMYKTALENNYKCDKYRHFFKVERYYFNKKNKLLHFAAKHKFIEIIVQKSLKSKFLKRIRTIFI